MLSAFQGVDDDGEPYEPFDRFTPNDADNYGLRFLYIQSCKRVGVNPDEAITTQLPPNEDDDDDDDDGDGEFVSDFDRVQSFVPPSEDSSIIGNSLSLVSSQLQKKKNKKQRNFAILDATRTYLGNGGCSALLPVLACSTHLTHLLLPHVGMQADVGKTLASMLAVHPSIQVVNLSENPLGYRVGQMLLTAALKNKNLTDMGLSGALIVDPLVQRIHKALAYNRRRLREKRAEESDDDDDDDDSEDETAEL